MNQNSTTTQTTHDSVHHSKPIPISTQHLRHRSTSFSSDSSDSPTSPPPLITPKNFSTANVQTSASSPILYFLSQSPTLTSATFPFRGFAPPPVFDGVYTGNGFRHMFDTRIDEPTDERKSSAHARRGSSTGRFPLPAVPEPLHERGVNVLRRLSLSGQRGKVCLFTAEPFDHLISLSQPSGDIPRPVSPQPPPNSAVSPSPSDSTNVLSGRNKPRRSVTVTERTRPRRAPSPMGERILKGHFDGFN
ncbi:hypothetical protein JVU11DRAFT_4068 [Chiua virens]|nr:hypothetical protein JVU11DRAFT_4068 [Chiua virens]